MRLGGYRELGKVSGLPIKYQSTKRRKNNKVLPVHIISVRISLDSCLLIRQNPKKRWVSGVCPAPVVIIVVLNTPTPLLPALSPGLGGELGQRRIPTDLFCCGISEAKQRRGDAVDIGRRCRDRGHLRRPCHQLQPPDRCVMSFGAIRSEVDMHIGIGKKGQCCVVGLAKPQPSTPPFFGVPWGHDVVTILPVARVRCTGL